jgi:hypothetical protein
MSLIKKLSVYFGLAASIAAIAVAYRTFVSELHPDGQLGLIILAFYAIIFLIIAIVQEYRFGHKARYAEAFYYFKNAYYFCLKGATEKPRNETNICLIAQQICDQISSGFGVITGTKCSVCIKILDKNFKKGRKVEIAVSTLCRDAASTHHRSTSNNSIVHWLDKNSDYLEMFDSFNKPMAGIFFNNNLPNKLDYANTSFEIYGKPKNVEIPFFRYFVRNFYWPLPYKSTIGAAIYPMIDKETPKDTARLLGFLCIDSASRGVFWKRYDTKILRSLAIHLYPLISRWYDIIEKKEQ